MTNSLHTLMDELIDYAGLFPPAGLPMDQAVQNYAAYLQRDERWALARFIVPTARLDEFAAEYSKLKSQTAWHLSVLINELEMDVLRIAAFKQQFHAVPAPIIDVVELKADSLEKIQQIRATLDHQLTAYVEIPHDPDPTPLILALRNTQLRAKIRTGGVTADAFPSPEQVLRFIATCAKHEVAFKATAGLHHPLRAEYRLTYEPNAPHGEMFGFLNVFLTAAWLWAGGDHDHAMQLLTERDPTSLQFTHDGVTWRDHVMSNDQIANARQSFAIAFGSCSFEEPINEVRIMKDESRTKNAEKDLSSAP